MINTNNIRKNNKTRIIVLIITCSILISLGLNYKKIIITNLLINTNFSQVDPSIARKLAISILDAAQIPDGDIALPSLTAHSKRYLISKWQRAALGSSVIVFGTDSVGHLCVALGMQRGIVKNPQGYMELPLPSEDLTGFKAQNASRLNSKTGQLVTQDLTIEDNAIREVYEEIGIHITKEDLILLRVINQFNANPVTLAIQYMVKLNNIPQLSTIDDEFLSDDLQSPQWIKISDIKYNDIEEKYFCNMFESFIDQETIISINLALKKLNLNEINKF